ncbi:MAG: alpha/beta fold hydrolase [Chloroflexota bacterium]|nr:alpha/beta hydrolase [Dehalococcoidia bacterium]MDW8046787.1 alpha/beta fold hydrolase [Chloroflexota bacterium]
MPYAHANGAAIWYQQVGRGPDLVFIHGAGANHLAWFQQIPAFAREFRCTVYDARGWGASRGSLDVGRWVFGTDLVALLDALGIVRAHFVAHSMGGRAVAGVIRHRPQAIQSIVFSGTNGGVADDRIRALQAAARARRGSSLREYALARGFAERAPGLAALYQLLNALNPPRPRGLLGPPPPSYRGSMHEAITRLGVPVLFVVGEFDEITPPEVIRAAAELVPGSEVAVIDGAGHSAYFERPQAWNEAVLDFLRRAEGRGSGTGVAPR